MKNKYSIVGDYVVVYINNKGQVLECYIDLQDLDTVDITGTWCGLDAGNKVYARGKNQGIELQMHKLILPTSNPQLIVDHIDGNGLNNRRSNLRLVGKSANARNVKKPRSDSQTGIRGVYYHKDNHNYIARIQLGNKRVNIGVYTNKYEAGRAYNRVCLTHFGTHSIIRVPIHLEQGLL